MSFSPLLKSNFRSWLGAKGFWLVVIAALLPLVLTGAWVGSHRADIDIAELRIEGEPLTEGQTARFVGVVTNAGSGPVKPFNLTVAVGTVTQFGDEIRLVPLEDNTTRIESLAPGETRELAIEWNATPGIVFALATADPDDEVGERDEFNNVEPKPIAVNYATPTTPPTKPLGLDGNVTSTSLVDISVVGPISPPSGAKPGDNVTFSVTFRNNLDTAVTGAQLNVRVVQQIGLRPTVRHASPATPVDLGPREERTVDLTWTTEQGAWWVEGYSIPPADAREATPEDSYVTEPLVVNPGGDFPEPPSLPERLTIKEFYVQLLLNLYLRIVLPLIALFYAAGVIADFKEQGALPYVLTRPVPRWIIPLTKFVASFLVAAIAVVVGVLLTYGLLFGFTAEGGDVGFLTTPLLVSLLTLFVYGALFTLLGTIFDRPYLVGLLFLLGWETIATVTGSAIGLASWVRNLTVTYHVQNAMTGWGLDQGIQWVPEGADAMRGLYVTLAIGAVAIAAAAVYMKRREFDVG